MNNQQVVAKQSDYISDKRMLRGALHRGGVPYMKYRPIYVNRCGAWRPVLLKSNFVK